jgi:hypothetical protein
VSRARPALKVTRASILSVLAISAVCLMVGISYGSRSASGLSEGESFHCGSALFGTDNSEGYRGTDGFEECDDRRADRLPLTIALLGFGGVAGVGGLWLVRRYAAGR